MPTAAEVFAEVKARLADDPSKVAGINAVYQFNISGDAGGNWYVDLTGDTPVVNEGEHENPNCTIVTDADTFVGVATGTINGQMAFMTGKLKIKGDMGLALKLQKILGG